MKLFVHFGIYKAGSSYLQYIAGNKRSELVNLGIWFPNSPDDSKMNAGAISAGNAFELSGLLKHKDFQKIEQYLKRIKEEATKRNCDKVLLSSEALVHQFAKKDGLELLSKTLKKTGFNQVYALAFFRDLVDHCISLYKHRSKAGKNPDFEYWLKEVYETPRVLNEFFKNYQSVDFEWTLTKFRNDSTYMVDTFFSQWLGVNIGSLPSKPQVNESITLSEVKVMQVFKSFYPKTSAYLLDHFISLPRRLKAKDTNLENVHRSIAGDILSANYNNDKKFWILTDGTPMEIEEFSSCVPELNTSKVELSLDQLSVIFESVNYLTGIRSAKLKIQKCLKGMLPKSLTKFLISLK